MTRSPPLSLTRMSKYLTPRSSCSAKVRSCVAAYHGISMQPLSCEPGMARSVTGVSPSIYFIHSVRYSLGCTVSSAMTLLPTAMMGARMTTKTAIKPKKQPTVMSAIFFFCCLVSFFLPLPSFPPSAALSSPRAASSPHGSLSASSSSAASSPRGSLLTSSIFHLTTGLSRFVARA